MKLNFGLWYKGVSKSSRTVLVNRSLLTLDVKFLHHLQSTPLLHEYGGPSVSAYLEASLEVPLWNCVTYPLWFLLNLFNGVKCSTLHPKLQLGEEAKVTGGQIGWVWGITVMFFLAKNCETLKDLWAGALSWWIMRFWYRHFCGLFRRTFSRNLLRTSQ